VFLVGVPTRTFVRVCQASGQWAVAGPALSAALAAAASGGAYTVLEQGADHVVLSVPNFAGFQVLMSHLQSTNSSATPWVFPRNVVIRLPSAPLVVTDPNGIVILLDRLRMDGGTFGGASPTLLFEVTTAGSSGFRWSTALQDDSGITLPHLMRIVGHGTTRVIMQHVLFRNAYNTPTVAQADRFRALAIIGPVSYSCSYCDFQDGYEAIAVPAEVNSPTFGTYPYSFTPAPMRAPAGFMTGAPRVSLEGTSMVNFVDGVRISFPGTTFYIGNGVTSGRVGVSVGTGFYVDAPGTLRIHHHHIRNYRWGVDLYNGVAGYGSGAIFISNCTDGVFARFASRWMQSGSLTFTNMYAGWGLLANVGSSMYISGSVQTAGGMADMTRVMQVDYGSSVYVVNVVVTGPGPVVPTARVFSVENGGYLRFENLACVNATVPNALMVAGSSGAGLSKSATSCIAFPSSCATASCGASVVNV
jgi:hypothetical protein